MIMSHYFFDGLILEARAEMQKYFRSCFGSNENLRICFRDLLTLYQWYPKYLYIAILIWSDIMAFFYICKKETSLKVFLFVLLD